MKSFAVDDCTMPPTIFLDDKDLIPTTSFDPGAYKSISSIQEQNRSNEIVPGNLILNTNIENTNEMDNYVKEFFAADNRIFRSADDANVNHISTNIIKLYLRNFLVCGRTVHG